MTSAILMVIWLTEMTWTGMLWPTVMAIITAPQMGITHTRPLRSPTAREKFSDARHPAVFLVAFSEAEDGHHHHSQHFTTVMSPTYLPADQSWENFCHFMSGWSPSRLCIIPSLFQHHLYQYCFPSFQHLFLLFLTDIIYNMSQNLL